MKHDNEMPICYLNGVPVLKFVNGVLEKINLDDDLWIDWEDKIEITTTQKQD